MKKKAICLVLVFLIILSSIATIVVYPEMAELKRRRDDPLAKKMKRLGLQYYPDREIGDVLEESVYYYVNSTVIIEGYEYLAPTLILCKTTDCFSQSSFENTEVSSLKSWSFEGKDQKSQIKAFNDAIDAIKSDYPKRYNLWLIFLNFYGQISNKQLWRLKHPIPIDDVNF